MKYIIYDMRALEDPFEATVFEVCDDLQEARESAKDYGTCCIFEATVENIKGSNQLTNQKLVEISYN